MGERGDRGTLHGHALDEGQSRDRAALAKPRTERVAAARADDEAVMAVVALAREYLAGWRSRSFRSAARTR